MDIESLYRYFLDCGMKVSTDSRTVSAGELFIALKGDNFNGNLFALQALEKGAHYVLVDEGEFTDPRIIKVENTLNTLQKLAQHHRRTLKPRVIAIGGSNGKTTTKELLVSILSTEYRVHFTKGNFNNHIGLPLTLLGLRYDHQIAVIEMGANKEGDIKELCEIAEPELGIITNIGKEHLEGFGSMEGVARAESELFDYLIKNEGHAFINTDDSWLINMSKRISKKTEYGKSVSEISINTLSPEIDFVYKDRVCRSPLMGEHNLQNIMAVIAIAEFFAISSAHIRSGIENYEPKNNRSQWVKTEKNNRLLMDAYNANPSSVEMALHAFQLISGFKIVLLGDMFELGDFEKTEHQNIAEMCSESTCDDIYLIGNAFAKTSVNTSKVHIFKSKEEAREAISLHNFKNVVVLIKGSRGMKMEDLSDLF